MKDTSEKFIQDRIRWSARKNGLPSGVTSWYEESNVPAALVHNAKRTGIPVLAIVAGNDQWTVLGTRKIITYRNCVLSEVDFGCISNISMPTEEQIPSKGDCDSLTIEDNSGRVQEFWAPRGREFFALYNILLRLKKLVGSPSCEENLGSSG